MVDTCRHIIGNHQSIKQVSVLCAWDLQTHNCDPTLVLTCSYLIYQLGSMFPVVKWSVTEPPAVRICTKGVEGVSVV